MYILDGIAYAENLDKKEKKVKEVKIISELCMVVTYNNGERRIFDAQYLMKYPAYKKLEDFEIFKNAYIENGMIVWDNGNIDISAETVYENSYVYETDVAI